jgi:anti-sigma factor RsiW
MRFSLGRNNDIACQQAVEMVTDYLEDAFDRGEKQRFEKHLSVCPHCTEYLAQVRETIRMAGRLTPEDLSLPMRDAFTDLYRRWRAEG